VRAGDGDDDWEWVEDPPPEPLTGGPPGDVDDSELSGLLGEMACGALKLGMLLSEADEDRWRAVSGRLQTFIDLVRQLPDRPRARRQVGFRVTVRKPRRR
jgi:hypothetical protein